MLTSFSHAILMFKLYAALTLFVSALYLGNYTSRLKSIFN